MPRNFSRFERRGHVAIITMDRPQVLNALHRDAHFEMRENWREFEADDDLWVAILTGEGGRAFSAGSDIKSIHDGVYATPPEGWSGLTRRPPTKPVIAAINGYALGGGLEAVLACDLAIAAEHASFGLPELKSTGDLPGDGGLLRIVRQLPPKVAFSMVLTGRFIAAPEALRYGLVSEVVPAERLMERAVELAEEVCGLPPIAVRVAKEFMLRAADLPASPDGAAWDLYDELLPAIRASADYRSGEGPKAFLEKRPPVWIGR
ncbi:MAG: enoyl-CoA hydratase-related protein [Dehalococcoidia bacterium]|jgi:enoyl-CoA hydratase/carnithine racemase|nr:enoyl-CoA hydratase-related protein [Dehalococcoidia bacterium]